MRNWSALVESTFVRGCAIFLNGRRTDEWMDTSGASIGAYGLLRRARCPGRGTHGRTHHAASARFPDAVCRPVMERVHITL
jgi:hypothetical protein